MQTLANSKWEFKCNLLCVLNLYIAIGTRHLPNLKFAQYITGIRTELMKGRELMEFIAVEVFIYWFIYFWL